jgi:hypothetical protein
MRGRLRCFCAEMKCACTRLCAHVTFLMWCSRVRRTSPHSIDVHRHLPRSSRVSPDLSTRTIARTADIFSTAHPLHPSDVTFIIVPSSRWSVRVWSSFLLRDQCAFLRTCARALAYSRAHSCTCARPLADSRAFLRTRARSRTPIPRRAGNRAAPEIKSWLFRNKNLQIADCSVSNC